MPNNGDYGKGSSGRGQSEETYLSGSPDHRAMMGYKGYKKDMYDAMGSLTPKVPNATGAPNTGIQGSGGDKVAPSNSYGKEGNTYKKDYAKMSTSQPKEVQKSPGGKKKKKGGKVKSIAQLRKMGEKY